MEGVIAGERGMFRSQLCKKILAGENVSPVVRQTLLHWGFEVTKKVLENHKKRKK